MFIHTFSSSSYASSSSLQSWYYSYSVICDAIRDEEKRVIQAV